MSNFEVFTSVGATIGQVLISVYAIYMAIIVIWAIRPFLFDANPGNQRDAPIGKNFNHRSPR